MGGFGSGRRWYYSAKSKVEDCCALDVNWMTREGFFDGGGRRSGTIRWSNPHTGEDTSGVGYELNARHQWMRLIYRLVRNDDRFDYKIALTTTELPWGGVRWWFVCGLTIDGRYCGRRVGKLYRPPGGRYFGCRHCHDLTYTSCQATRRPSWYWAWMGDVVGISAGDMKLVWEDDLKWEQRMKRQAKRNEQRRRRRKARNWA